VDFSGFPGLPAPRPEAYDLAGNLAPGWIDMGSHISFHGYGKLSIGPETKARLLVVFGGITVDNVQSGA
jgi:hypothetical protein